MPSGSSEVSHVINMELGSVWGHFIDDNDGRGGWRGRFL